MVSKKRPRVIIFPIDCMRGKSKKQYMNIGKVKVSNMYEVLTEIPSLEEIRAMEKKSGKKCIENLRKLHSAKDLAKQWGTSTYTFYNHILKEYEIQTDPRKKRETNNSKEKELNEVAIDSTNFQEEKNVIQHKQEELQPVPEVPKVFRGYKIELGKILTGEIIQNSIMNIISMLDKESSYDLSLSIVEKEIV